VRRALPWLLVAASIAVRLAAFLQLDATPFLHMERWAQTDMHYYDGWARRIAAGDWLSAAVPLPMHRWHHEVAQAYFTQHPDVRAAIAREGHDPDTTIWSRWMRTPRFYQDPLYPYLLAVLYRFVSADVRAMLILQLAAGALTTLLVWSVARRHFGDVAGACAGVMALLCAPPLFYELLLLRDSLIACAGLTIVWLADRAIERDGWRWPAALGIALGLAFLLKSSFLLLAIGVIPIVVVSRRYHRRAVLQPAAALAAGVAIAILPLAVRNVRVGVPPLSMASSGPLTLVSANDAGALPDVGFGIDVPRLTQFLGDTDGSWRAAVAAVRERQSIGGYAAMTWRKWDRAWHWFEIPNNEDLYYFREQVPVLDWLPVTFWACAPLALAGIVLAALRARRPWTLFALVAASVASLVTFYVLGRFRDSLAVASLPFAGLALAELATAVRARHLVRGAAIAAAVIVAALWTGRPLAGDQVLIRTSDWILAWSIDYQDRVYGALDRHDPAAAGAFYEEFFARYEPSAQQIIDDGDPRLAPELADMHAECAQILRAAGRVEAAQVQIDAARRLVALGQR
jgi:4-amino-4-deoxy-L-arabinose transferase-like glycosyltransferase